MTGLAAGETYEGQVRAVNVVGNGPYSPIAMVTTSALSGLLLTTGRHLLLATGSSLELEG